jgi:hypothetical protein
MKKNILLALPLCALTIACAEKGPDETTVCQSVTIPPNCVELPSPKININVASGLTVAPPNICAHPGQEIQVTVTPPTSSVTVATVPKNSANKWMFGSTSPVSDEFTIPVPGDQPIGRYKYLIVTGSGYCLDPRIEVN